MVYRYAQEPDEYDTECLQCHSLDVCESPIEALFESIRQVEKLAFEVERLKAAEVERLKAARPKVGIARRGSVGAEVILDCGCSPVIFIVRGNRKAEDIEEEQMQSVWYARTWAIENGFEVEP